MNIHPSVAVPPWDYEPTGPYVFTGAYVGDVIPISVGTSADLDLTVTDAARFFLPPLPDQVVSVRDAHQRILLGWISRDGNPPTFFGCGAGFAALERIYDDQLAVACWEIEARQAVTT
jgi:hypothetical protein